MRPCQKLSAGRLSRRSFNTKASEVGNGGWSSSGMAGSVGSGLSQVVSLRSCSGLVACAFVDTVGPRRTDCSPCLTPLPPPPVLSFGPFSLDRANARLLRNGQPLELVPKDLDVLCFLAERPGRLVSKGELLDAVWQRRFVSESVLKNGISRLRAVLGDDARQPRYIETAQRRGYRFIAAVHEGAEPTAPVAAPAWAASNGPAWVERGAALTWLQRQLLAAQGGSTRLALLAGEAGIGKTSLVERFAQAAAEGQAMSVAFGQCVEHTASVEPYLPLLDALSALCRAAPEAGLVALMHQVAPSWLMQLPWLLTPDERLALQRETAGTTQERMLRECGEFLDRATEARPLLLVIEDLHWSDAATLLLIGYLARRRGSARVLLLATLRPAVVVANDHACKALRLALREQRLCDEFELELFSESEAAHFLRQRCPAMAWPDSAVRRLHEQTGGLPLFLAAVADDWTGENAPDQTASEVPRSIFGLIERQHQRLSEALQRWLEAAAVAGVEFVHAPLADALGVPADALQAAFDAFVRQRAWLRELGPVTLPDGRVGVRYAFRHAIYRQVLYELAGAAARVQWHRRLAAALLKVHGADVDAVAAEVAVHFELGQDPAQAVRHLAPAAQRALQRFASAEAVAIAQRALDLLQALPQRTALRDTELELEVVLGVSLAATQGVASAASCQAFDRTRHLMEGLPATAARVPAMHGIWWSALVRGEVARARGMAVHALAQAHTRDDPGLRFAGDAALGITLVHAGDFGAAQTHLQQALDAHSGLGAEAPSAMFTFEPEVQLSSYLAESLWWQGRAEEAHQCSARAMARAQVLKHPLSLLLALSSTALLRGHAGDFEGARVLSAQALQFGLQHGLQRGTGTSLWVHGRARAALGEVDEGLAQMQQGLRLQHESGLVHGLARWHAWFAQACLEAGRLGEAEAALHDGLALAERTGEHAASSALHRLQGQLLQRRDRHAEASAAWAQALEVARRQGSALLQALVHAAVHAAAPPQPSGPASINTQTGR